MVLPTEQEARDMHQAITDFQDKDSQAESTQQQADLATAQTWYDTTIEPTLTWRNTQTDRQQLQNTFSDRDTLEATVTADRFRQTILRNEIEKLTTRIRQIKSRL